MLQGMSLLFVLAVYKNFQCIALIFLGSGVSPKVTHMILPPFLVLVVLYTCTCLILGQIPLHVSLFCLYENNYNQLEKLLMIVCLY